MRTGDVIAAAFWLAIALGIAYAGRDLGLGRLNEPGSGFMIFWVGVVMAALSAAALVAALRQPAGDGLASLWSGLRWHTVPYVIVLLLGYAWLLPVLGFVAVTVLLLVTLFRTVDPRGWVASIAGAVVITAATYLVFGRWLGTQLPAGTLWGTLAERF
jgi:putative tricarboxylic transport membrane protein